MIILRVSLGQFHLVFVNFLVPSIKIIKHRINGPNDMDFPTQPWFLRGCLKLGGRDCITSLWISPKFWLIFVAELSNEVDGYVRPQVSNLRSAIAVFLLKVTISQGFPMVPQLFSWFHLGYTTFLLKQQETCASRYPLIPNHFQYQSGPIWGCTSTQILMSF